MLGEAKGVPKEKVLPPDPSDPARFRAPTRSTPRYGRSVAGLRNCTPSARYAEATTATRLARLVTRETVLAGGEPNTFRIAARSASAD